MFDAHPEMALEAFDRVLDAIGAAFEARRIQLPRSRAKGIETGVAIEVGPDHSATLAAVELFIKVMTSGRALPKALPVNESITIEEIELLVEADAAEKRGDCPAEQREHELPQPQQTATLPSLVAARRERVEELLERMWNVENAALTSSRGCESQEGECFYAD